MFPADTKYDPLPDLICDGITQGIIHKCFDEDHIGLIREKLFLEITGKEGLLLVLIFFVAVIHNSISFVGKKLCGDLCSCIHYSRIHQEGTVRIIDAIDQGITEGWFPAFAAKCPIGIQ